MQAFTSSRHCRGVTLRKLIKSLEVHQQNHISQSQNYGQNVTPRSQRRVLVGDMPERLKYELTTKIMENPRSSRRRSRFLNLKFPNRHNHKKSSLQKYFPIPYVY